MQNKLSSLLRLIRFYNPTGTLLLFFPCSFGVLLGAQTKYDAAYLLIFLIGSFIMRSAGCIINDIWDREIDAKVDRTKNRPLVTGEVTFREALLLLGVFLFAGVVILLSLSGQAILIALFAMILVFLYPMMKRITFWPQAFLGVTYNVGTLIAYSTVHGSITLAALLAYVGCVFWTIGYDTIYAFMDIKDDPKAGVKSSALFLQEKNYHKWLLTIYGIFVKTMVVAIIIGEDYKISTLIISTIFVATILIWQVQTLDIHSRSNCLIRFKSNILVGLIWTITLL